MISNQTTKTGLESAGPLSGVRVMDVSIMAAGPWTGALLGMLGAEVIKVEPPAGDGTRWVMPTQHGMGTILSRSCFCAGEAVMSRSHFSLFLLAAVLVVTMARAQTKPEAGLLPWP